MKPIRYFKGLRLVVKPVSYQKTLIMLSYVKDKRLWPSGVIPIGAECLAFVDDHEGPVMSTFAAANTQCEASHRARFYVKQHLNKRMKRDKPSIRSTVKGEFHATMYLGGVYHHGYGVTIEAAIENAKYNIENFGKIIDEIVESEPKENKVVPWYKRWFN